jgi:uncharacterized damage-inducible protein DinB
VAVFDGRTDRVARKPENTKRHPIGSESLEPVYRAAHYRQIAGGTMTPEQATAVRDVLVGSIEQEGVAERKVIAAIPNGNRDFKPDPKSRSAWEIAVHVAMADVWFADSIMNGRFVWTGEPATPPEMTDPNAVAAWHERAMKDRLAKLRALGADRLLQPVDFFGRTAPAVIWLSAMNNHMIHHRGQLAAYLRAAGSKVPAIYGMSADENAMT